MFAGFAVRGFNFRSMLAWAMTLAIAIGSAARAETPPLYKDVPAETAAGIARLIAFDRMADAIRAGNRILKAHPQDLAVYELTALAYWRNGQTLSAQELTRRGLEERYSEALLVLLVRLELALGRDDEVLALWQKYKERVTEHSARSEEIVIDVLLAYIHLNNIKDGIYEFGGILKDWPRSYRGGQIYFYGAILNALAKRKSEAVAQTVKALDAGWPPGDFERDPDLKNVDATPEFKTAVDRAWKDYTPLEGWQEFILALAALDLRAAGLRPLSAKVAASDVARLRTLLKEEWNINSASDLESTLDWLTKEGHRSMFDDISAHLKLGLEKDLLPDAVSGESDNQRRTRVVREFREELGLKSLIGWDYARLIALCRMGALTGLMKEEEAWDRSLAAAGALQRSFKSWHEFSRNYLIGLEFRSGFQSTDSAFEFYRALDDLRANPDSPWKTIKWETPLPEPQPTPQATKPVK